MNAYEIQINNYKSLNTIAANGGIILFGGTSDKDLPVSELCRSFELKEELYNRSFSNLSLAYAEQLYKECVAPISPEAVLLHIGVEDKELFAQFPSRFDSEYRSLIKTIRTKNKKCRIAVLSITNPENDPVVDEMNSHLSAIADSNNCDYCNISRAMLWNPERTKELYSFLSNMGLLNSITFKRPLRDIVKILYGYKGETESVVVSVLKGQPAVGTPAFGGIC